MERQKVAMKNFNPLESLLSCVYGTPSHVVDPKNPGVVDEILHLGDFWNEGEMKKGRADVLRINAKVGTLFERAYRYLGAAAHIYEDISGINALALDTAGVNRLARKLADEVFGDLPQAAATGRERCLFASAITPDGLKNYLNDLIGTENVYMLEGEQGTGTEKVLEKMKNEALERGLCVESYYCAFNPGKLEHLIIPALDTAFTTGNQYHSFDGCAYKKIGFTDLLDGNILNGFKEELDFDREEFGRLLDRAVHTIQGAKALHDEMESYYIPYMDFNAVQTCWERTMKRILGYAGESGAES
jgi:hypothetical protein